MNTEERAQVISKLEELEGWAEYIVEALHVDHNYEPVKCHMLKGMLEKDGLRQVRELSWSLRDRLHVLTTELQYTGEDLPLQPVR